MVFRFELTEAIKDKQTIYVTKSIKGTTLQELSVMQGRIRHSGVLLRFIMLTKEYFDTFHTTLRQLNPKSKDPSGPLRIAQDPSRPLRTPQGPFRTLRTPQKNPRPTPQPPINKFSLVLPFFLSFFLSSQRFVRIQDFFNGFLSRNM